MHSRTAGKSGTQSSAPHFFRCSLCIGTILFAAITASDAQELIYDPEKGIIFTDEVEKKDARKQQKTERVIPEPKEVKPAPKTVQPPPPAVKSHLKTVEPKGDRVDLHTGRKADPPELFFASGLEYFKNQDFGNALRNFEFADSADPQPRYTLWVGKTLRQAGKYDRMLLTMKGILEKHANSDVADDALFEMAVYYQSTDDYEMATKLYTQLAEQYPFGVSFGSGEEFLEIAREQRRTMRGEMVSILTMLGFSGEDLSESYRMFQKANGLAVTGIGSRETVKAIKKMHQEHIDQEHRLAQQEQDAGKYMGWAIGAGSIGLLNLLLMIGLRMQIRSKYRHLAVLRQTLVELDTNKLTS